MSRTVRTALSAKYHILCSDSVLSRKFSSTFAEFTLAELLSNFSLPVSLGDLKELLKMK